MFRTLRTHWKKSIFFSCSGGFLTKYLKERWDDRQLMRKFCFEAKKLGDFPLKRGEQPRKVAVILNPVAKKGKASIQFDKWCAPLLHLAGVEVSIIRTEGEGQAKEIVENFSTAENPVDTLVIAGGDGTVLEAITGLLRRSDALELTRRVALGVVPVGASNTVATRLFQGESGSVRNMLEATMAVIRAHIRPLDVIKIEAEDSPKPPVYAAYQIRTGPFQDVEMEIPKYWYYGPAKRFLGYVTAGLKGVQRSAALDLQLEYTPPCSGCSRCQGFLAEASPKPSAPEASGASSDSSSSSRPWWQRWFNFSLSQLFASSRSLNKRGFGTADEETVDYSKVDNPECDRWREVFLFGTTDLLIRAMGDGTLSITAGKNQLPFQEFVSFGRELKRRILTFDHPLVASAFKAQRLRVTPLSTPSGQQRVVSSTEQQAEEEAVLEEGTGGKHRNVTIDSEQFELRPFTLTLLRDRIRFCY
ncbi:unnamed protein product [Cyprideis torosa]|uniref:Uncharacterized protein n=1 Tax=Cyprideis torosa TaxID=163714 RepID=A0A7R8W0G8_9CRUS|nr:unnamed protein product [Cyprideis torosa]CAG0879724.1 unnamed protein product [Cyprideis torosa]